MDIVDCIMRYEGGEMEPEGDEEIAFFQRLIDTGMAWTLQGHYGRKAASFIHSGLCERSK